MPRQLGSRLPDPGSAYSFDETEFLNLYNRALEQRKMGEKPSSPTPQDPSETGFGVLPWTEKPTEPAPAFLPLQERALTEEEMLQLAWGMEGLSGEELLKPEHARTGVLSGEAGYEALLQNRAFHEEERRRLLLLEPAYLYDGRQASADPDGALLLVSLQEDKEFAILPLENLSEEGLLHCLDVKYAGVSLAEDLLPTEEEAFLSGSARSAAGGKCQISFLRREAAAIQRHSDAERLHRGKSGIQ